jgi:hypothetical protein
VQNSFQKSKVYNLIVYSCQDLSDVKAELDLMGKNFKEPIAFEISVKYRELNDGGGTINPAFDNKLEDILPGGLAGKDLDLFVDAFPLPAIAKNANRLQSDSSPHSQQSLILQVI